MRARHLLFVVVLVSCTNCSSSLTFAAEPVEVPQKGVQWIWDSPVAASEPQSNEPRYFRHVETLAKKPTKGELFVTADNRYVAYVNGRKVGGDGEWQSVERYDVTGLLLAGRNVIAIEAINSGAAAGMIAWLRLEGDDKKTSIVGTSSDWRVSLEKQADWTGLEIDDKKWRPASLLGDTSISPWNLAGTAKPSTGAGSTDVNVTDKTITNYRPADEEQKNFELPPGFVIELVVAEPQVINPVCLALDEQGRMYVSESHTYRFGPSGSPVPTPTNPIVRLDPLPDGKGYKRTVVAEGFDDPVMGMAIRDGKLWAAANQYLFRFDLTEAGPATNKQTLLTDKNKAWNPFGNFVLEWGPEGWLYISIGNHAIDITGPDGSQLAGRGGSGVVARMRPDGSQLQRLVHGLRVPYSFEFDPFGQLWVLSNGEGNPNRFVRVIDGVDYHCYSRPTANNDWLAGRHLLAPPCFELPRGACTQLLRYYGAAYPASFTGSLFMDNWGAHGFGGANRTIFRYVPDNRGNIVEKQPWLVCRDPHFRCSHLQLDPAGNMLIADWYGRDDESDLTGRVWRVRYMGEAADGSKLEAKPVVDQTLDFGDKGGWKVLIAQLGSADHWIREKAVNMLLAKEEKGVAPLEDLAIHVAESRDALGAATALWAMTRMTTSQAPALIAGGAKNPDARVRRLALHILRRSELFTGEAAAKSKVALQEIATSLARDPDIAVRLEAAIALTEPLQVRAALLSLLKEGAAEDPHLRYEAAWHLAKNANAATIQQLLQSQNQGLRIAGLIAVDVACYEDFATKPAAVEALAELLSGPGDQNWDLPLTLAQMNRDPNLVLALEKLVAREDVSAEVTARAILAIRVQGGNADKLGAEATRRFLDAVQAGKVRPSTPSDNLMLLELLSTEGPTPFAVREVSGRLFDNNRLLRDMAHSLAREFGPKASAAASSIWLRLLDTKSTLKTDEKLQMLATLVAIEEPKNKENWRRLLQTGDPTVVSDAVRSWRAFSRHNEMLDLLSEVAPQLVQYQEALAPDLVAVLMEVNREGALANHKLPPRLVDGSDEPALRKFALQVPTGETHVLLGRRVFERAGCVKCHTTVNQNALRAPSLQGIGKAQKPEYLVESVFEPSKIIKTGFEIESIELKDGRVVGGLVKEEGGKLRIILVDSEMTVAKEDVEQRTVQKKSLMPEGLFKQLSPLELRDLMAYLQSLK